MDPVHEYHGLYNYVGNNPINLIDPDGASSSDPDDIILLTYNEDGLQSTQIFETEGPDVLYMTGDGIGFERIGYTDANYFPEGSNISGGMRSFFAQQLGSSLLNENFYGRMMGKFETDEFKKSLYMARFDVGTSQDFNVLGKSMALGLGVFSGAATGVGIAMGGAGLIGTGTTIGTAGNALTTGLEIRNGNIEKASINASYMLISYGAGIGIRHVTRTNNFLDISNVGGKTLVGNKAIIDKINFSTIGATQFE